MSKRVCADYKSKDVYPYLIRARLYILFLDFRIIGYGEFSSVLGDLDHETAIFAILAFNVDLFAQMVHNGTADVKPQSYAGLIQTAALVTLIKSVEYMGQILLRDSLALVIYADTHKASLVRYGDPVLTALT